MKATSEKKKALVAAITFHIVCIFLCCAPLFLKNSPPKKPMMAIPIQFMAPPPTKKTTAIIKTPAPEKKILRQNVEKKSKNTAAPVPAPLPLKKKKTGRKTKPTIRQKKKKTAPQTVKKNKQKPGNIENILNQKTLAPSQKAWLIESVQKQLMQCWSMTQSLREAKNLKIAIHLTMNRDGSVKHAKIDALKSTHQHPKFQMGKASALKAVHHPMCSPFTLPEEYYEDWKEIFLTFSTDDL